MTRNFYASLLPAFALLAAGFVGVGPAVTPAFAQTGQNVSLSSVVEIERAKAGADGKAEVTFQNPKDVTVVPGDTLRFTLSYQNLGDKPATGFRAVNPLPSAVRFVSVDEDWAEVSVDGGQSWGQLENLTVSVKGEDGAVVTRTAVPDDVTHVRWNFAEPIAPMATGQLRFYGAVK